ncbi:MAG: exo-alpha-sialidase [Gammaproteobacteria bacterium]|nr:exo-alpha-sialidase [Gammaproteobacteria bacterium]
MSHSDPHRNTLTRRKHTPLSALACACVCALLFGDANARAEPAFQLAVTAAFAPDGRLWRLRSDSHQVYADHSDDFGTTFSKPIPVNTEPQPLAVSVEERANIAFAGAAVHVAYPVAAGTGASRLFHALSTDAGRSFSTPQPLAQMPGRLHRFAVNAAGEPQHFWYQEPAPGAPTALYRATADLPQQRLATGLCDCCRPALAFDPEGQAVIAARFVYPGNIRDHGLIRVPSLGPAAVQRITFDQWQIAACPIQGPALAITQAGRHHLAWFTLGAHRGLFRSYSDDAGAHFSAPEAFGDPDTYAMNPAVAAQADAVVVLWQEYHSGSIRVLTQRSADRGASWGPARELATATGAADRPELLVHENRFYLSWHARGSGYRLLPIPAEP